MTSLLISHLCSVARCHHPDVILCLPCGAARCRKAERGALAPRDGSPRKLDISSPDGQRRRRHDTDSLTGMASCPRLHRHRSRPGGPEGGSGCVHALRHPVLPLLLVAKVRAGTKISASPPRRRCPGLVLLLTIDRGDKTASMGLPWRSWLASPQQSPPSEII